ncbi:MAG: hypothetical protein OEZ39_02340 [Gammaproteobacteria bacterium]|nr:hypothetical protein [Gammaproteobacteria bacterium]MDH5650693.1 hypothetical protein [Gammaproteobacteria bacterium]
MTGNTFKRYPHINDLLQHYVDEFDDKKIAAIINNGVDNEEEAIAFSRFVWRMAGQMNEDERDGKVVLGSTDNSEMFPDLDYEITKYMKSAGFYSTWDKISKEEAETD